MTKRQIFKKPVHNAQGKQPWYVRWSKGNEFKLFFNTYIDILFVGSVLGILFSILFPFLNNIIFISLILTIPIPLTVISVMYYKFIYHYKSSTTRYGLKPSFRFIFLYMLLVQSIFITFSYIHTVIY